MVGEGEGGRCLSRDGGYRMYNNEWICERIGDADTGGSEDGCGLCFLMVCGNVTLFIVRFAVSIFSFKSKLIVSTGRGERSYSIRLERQHSERFQY